jgi:long-chain acyl-CoA synthetase
MKRIWLDSYAPGVPADIQPKHASLVELLDEASAAFASRPAFASLGAEIDYAGFGRLSRDFAAYLQQRLGLAAGDRIALMMPNQLAYAVAIAAALRAGLVVVNVNPQFTPRELRHQLEDSGAVALLALSQLEPVVQQVLADTAVTQVMFAELTDLTGADRGTSDFAAALAEGSSLRLDAPPLAASDLAFLQYTGGTTGEAKGAMLSHGNVLANIEQNRVWSQGALAPGEEVLVSALPMYHIYGLTINYFMGIAIGGLGLLIHDPRDCDALIAQLGQHPFSLFSGVNTMFNALLLTPGFEDLDFTHLKATYGGGMSVQRPVAQHWVEVTGSCILEGYGLTECSPVVSGNRHDAVEFTGTVGLPYPATYVSIRDEDDEEVSPGCPGELCVYGPQVMSGYWRRAAASRNARTGDDYFRTGDIATLDESGHLRIVDRMKDMILVSGFNVYPNEVEEVAMTMPGVAEVACVGAPDDRAGELVKLLVVPRAGVTLTEAAVREHCRGQLTGYKVPRVVEFRDALPKSAVGKVLRRLLREPTANG